MEEESREKEKMVDELQIQRDRHESVSWERTIVETVRDWWT
jgi:hypothetical protein